MLLVIKYRINITLLIALQKEGKEVSWYTLSISVWSLFCCALMRFFVSSPQKLFEEAMGSAECRCLRWISRAARAWTHTHTQSYEVTWQLSFVSNILWFLPINYSIGTNSASINLIIFIGFKNGVYLWFTVLFEVQYLWMGKKSVSQVYTVLHWQTAVTIL